MTTKINLASGEQVQGILPVASGGSGQGSYSPALIGQPTQQSITNSRFFQRVSTIAGATAPTINTDSWDAVSLTAITAAINMGTNWSGTGADFQDIIIRFKSAAAQAITWGSMHASSGVATLPTTTVAGKTITVGLIYDVIAAKWYCMAVDAAGY